MLSRVIVGVSAPRCTDNPSVPVCSILADCPTAPLGNRGAVVGVVTDTTYEALHNPFVAIAYMPRSQTEKPPADSVYLIRSQTGVAGLMNSVKEVVAGVNPDSEKVSQAVFQAASEITSEDVVRLQHGARHAVESRRLRQGGSSTGRRKAI